MRTGTTRRYRWASPSASSTRSISETPHRGGTREPAGPRRRGRGGGDRPLPRHRAPRHAPVGVPVPEPLPRRAEPAHLPDAHRALVNVLPIYDPLRLAEEIAVLDQLCAGRLDLGVGRGVSPYELAYFGVSDQDSRALFTETLDVVTTALATGRMVHRGERLRDYDVELSVRPVQQPHPPLWYASSNTDSAEWAGRTASTSSAGGTAAPSPPPRTRTGMPGRPAPGRTAGPRGSGWPRPSTSATPTPRRWTATARPTTSSSASSPSCGTTTTTTGSTPVDTDAGLRRGAALVGSPQTVRDLLLEQVERADINYFEATLAFGDLTPAESIANLEAFTEVVMPAVRAATAGRPRTPDRTSRRAGRRVWGTRRPPRCCGSRQRTSRRPGSITICARVGAQKVHRDQKRSTSQLNIAAPHTVD